MAILESLPDEPIKRTMLLQVVRIGDVTYALFAVEHLREPREDRKGVEGGIHWLR